MADESVPLCSRCQDFDLSPILDCEGHPEHWPDGYRIEASPKFKLGMLRSIHARAESCDLCAFVCTLLERCIDTDTLVGTGSHKGLKYSCDLVWEYYAGSWKDARYLFPKPIESVYRLDVVLLCQGDVVSSVPNALQPTSWPVPRSNLDDQSSQFWEILRAGRLRSPIYEPDIARTWLNICESSHTRCWWSGPKARLRLRLFDIKFQAIRDFHISRDDTVRYVTLSYVWGSQIQSLTLTRANHSKLSTKGAVTLNEVSRTIADAATVVQMLGERYLWVDALFIVQDDPNDLAAQIPLMGQIYARSLLTIVAAASVDAESGLPGIESQARSTQSSFGPFKGGALLTTCNPKLKQRQSATDMCADQHYLADSKRRTRGWTYQEQMLSRRCIFFTQEQVYWECQCASWCEDACQRPMKRLDSSGKRVSIFTGKQLSMGHFCRYQTFRQGKRWLARMSFGLFRGLWRATPPDLSPMRRMLTQHLPE